MIQFHLSKDAAKDLAMHVGDKQPVNSQALQWYLHRVTVARRKCIIAMELQSRYTTVFCGLTKKELADFPSIFGERFWREALLVLDMEYALDNSARDELAYWSQEISSIPCFQLGHDRSVSAHIADVLMLLRLMVESDGYPLPVDEMDALSFGIQVNQTYRRSKMHPDWFVPITEYRQFWAGLLGRVCGIALRSHSETEANRESDTKQPASEKINNVVQVDFSTGRKI